MKDFNIQLFGADCPPLYGIKSIMAEIEEVSKLDEQINELLILREEKVESIKEAIKNENNSKE